MTVDDLLEEYKHYRTGTSIMISPLGTVLGVSVHALPDCGIVAMFWEDIAGTKIEPYAASFENGKEAFKTYESVIRKSVKEGYKVLWRGTPAYG